MFFAMSGLSSKRAAKPKYAKIMKIRSIALLSLVSLGIPLAAQPQNPRNPGRSADRPANFERVLERFDANQNGSLSKDEVGRRLADNFEAIDADGDGELSASELTAAREGGRQRVKEKADRIKDADVDGNRAISIDEASAAGMQRLVDNFDRIDADGDGEITRREMRAFRQARMNRKGPAQ